MTGSSWGATALLLLHLMGTGALPKEVTTTQVAPYAAARPVRVLLFQSALLLTLRPATAVEATGGAGLHTLAAGQTLTARAVQGGVLLQAPGRRVIGREVRLHPAGAASTLISAHGGVGTRGKYPGDLTVRAVNGRVEVVAEMDLEAYLAGVVAAEVPRTFPAEAMRAQAIAARTYTLFHLGDHAAQGADLCSQVHCQAYAGDPPASSPARRAVMETAGEVLAYHGVLIDAQYHAACGGDTVAAWETRQGKVLPYLCGGSDTGADGAYCAESHPVTWTQQFSFAQAQRLISRNLPLVLGNPHLSPGRLRALRVSTRTGARVQWLEVVTSTGTYRCFGDSARWLFGTGRAGPSGLRSTRFSVRTVTGPAGQPRSFVFSGAGHGHGIGLCQWGARGRALAGQSAEEMLAAYYPGAVVTDLRTESMPHPEA